MTTSVVLCCSRGAVKEQLPPFEQYQLAMRQYEKEDYLKAQSEFQKLIYSFPGQSFIDTAQYYLAMTYFKIGSYPEAVGEFKRLLQTYPGSGLADDAQFQIAMAHYDESPRYSLEQTETYAAIDEFSVLVDKYPGSPHIADTQEKLDVLYDKLAKKLYKSGELYMKLNDYDPALIYFGQVRDNYPNTEWAILAFYYSGLAQLKSGRKSDALETFQNFVTAFPENKLARKAQKQISKLATPETGG
jgi:outer membrane protein assembly factor BamD